MNLAQLLGGRAPAGHSTQKAEGHTHVLVVEGQEHTTSRADGDPHTHTVSIDGVAYTTAGMPSEEAHTHNVEIEDVVLTTGGPVDEEQTDKSKQKGKKPYQKLLRKLADDHNRAKPTHKARIRPLQLIAKRAIEARTNADFPGVDEEAWVINRGRAFMAALLEKGSTEDSDLLPVGHPLAPAPTTHDDPWAELDTAEERLAALAREGLSKIDRASVRSADVDQLVTWSKRLDFLYDSHFANSEQAESASGVSREGLVKSAGWIQGEFLRRGHIPTTSTPLSKLAAESMGQAPTPRSGQLLQSDAGTQLVLKAGPSITLLDARADVSAGTWHPDGSRRNTSMREPHAASYIGTAKAEGTVAADLHWSWGYRGEEVSEIFIGGGSPLDGTLLIGKAELSLRKGLVPLVLSDEMVEAGWMPPEGESALPPSLEQDVPPEYRYWKAAPGEDPQEIRDRLVNEHLFTTETIKLVNGEARRVEVRYALADEPVATQKLAEVPPTLSAVERAVKAMPADFGVDSSAGTLPVAAAALAGSDWEEFAQNTSDTAAFLFDESLAEETSPVIVADRLRAWPTDFIAAYPDSPEAREALYEVGPLFKMQHDSADLLYVASRAPLATAGVQLVAPEAPAEPDPTPEVSEETAALMKRAVRLVKTSATEERFVFGIVLEPETIDAQDDIYSAEDIRKSAHRFMAEYRNAGLMHEGLINDQVQILESYVAPADMEVDGVSIKKGTWLMAYKVLSDTIWAAIKAEELTGFSIGGSAIRTPEEV